MIEIFTDGGSRGNPGLAASAFVVYKGADKIFETGKKIGHATNNVAEYTAVLTAFEWIATKTFDENKINFYLDSELVVRQLNGIYKIKDKNLQRLVQKIQNIKKNLNFKIAFTAIPRAQNERADFLVNRALDEKSS